MAALARLSTSEGHLLWGNFARGWASQQKSGLRRRLEQSNKNEEKFGGDPEKYCIQLDVHLDASSFSPRFLV